MPKPRCVTPWGLVFLLFGGLSLPGLLRTRSTFTGSVNGGLVAPEAEAGTVSATARLLQETDAALPVEIASRRVNRDGSFQFCGLAAPGKYRVVVDMTGYDRVESEFTLSLAAPRRPRLEIVPESRRAARKETSPDSLAGYDELLERFSTPTLCSGGQESKASYRFVWIRDENPPLILEVRFGKDGSITAERQTLELSSGTVDSSGTIDLVSLHKARGGGSFVASRVPRRQKSFSGTSPFG